MLFVSSKPKSVTFLILIIQRWNTPCFIQGLSEYRSFQFESFKCVNFIPNPEKKFFFRSKIQTEERIFNQKPPFNSSCQFPSKSFLSLMMYFCQIMLVRFFSPCKWGENFVTQIKIVYEYKINCDENRVRNLRSLVSEVNKRI